MEYMIGPVGINIHALFTIMFNNVNFNLFAYDLPSQR